MKKEIKTIHINNDVWKYIVQPPSGNVTRIRIFRPDKKLFSNVHASELLKSETFYDPGRKFEIKPSDVKKYIMEKINCEQRSNLISNR